MLTLTPRYEYYLQPKKGLLEYDTYLVFKRKKKIEIYCLMDKKRLTFNETLKIMGAIILWYVYNNVVHTRKFGG